MGFKNPIGCKDVISPIRIEDTGLTLEAYKNKYGIDLKEFISLDEDTKYIKIKQGDYKLLIRNNIVDKIGVNVPVIIPSVKATPYVSESHGAELIFGDVIPATTGAGDDVASISSIMVLYIDGDVEFSLENLKIYHGDNF